MKEATREVKLDYCGNEIYHALRWLRLDRYSDDRATRPILGGRQLYIAIHVNEPQVTYTTFIVKISRSWDMKDKNDLLGN